MQWLKEARKTEGTDTSPNWLSWIEVCALFARARVALEPDAIFNLPQYHVGQDGQKRWHRLDIEDILEGTKNPDKPTEPL